ncbi:MAG: hypothetical protein RO469_01750 [Thermincola sp.]|nr:hypothetical protein [Thermincola sp.]MDT3702377.1 hypothetical protein [Thermincola sp.]
MTLSQETCLNTFAEPCEEQGDVGNTWNDGKVSAYLGWNFFCACRRKWRLASLRR